MPVPPPTLPSSTGPECALLERLEDVLGLHVKAVDVVQPAVPGLRHHRQRPPGAGGILGPVRDAPGDDRIAHHADAVGVGDHHRAFEEPDSSTQVVPVISPLPFSANQPAKEKRWMESRPARQDRGDPGAHRPLADHQLAAAGDERRVADEDAGDVGDGIQRAGRAVEGHAEVAGPQRGPASAAAGLRHRRRGPGRSGRRERGCRRMLDPSGLTGLLAGPTLPGRRGRGATGARPPGRAGCDPGLTAVTIW